MSDSIARVIIILLRALGLKTLDKQFLFSYALIFLLASTAAVSLHFSMSVSPETINVAGAQRMLSQKMTKEALLIVQGVGKSEDLSATRQVFATAHQDLLKGNPAKKISAINDDIIQQQMQQVDRLWRDFQQQIDRTINSKTQADVIELQRQSVNLLKNMNTAVVLMTNKATDSQRIQLWLAFGSVSSILLLVVLGRIFGISHLMNNINRLLLSMQRVGKGDFTQKLNTHFKDDEIGQMFTAFNKMQQEVTALIQLAQQTASASNEKAKLAASSAKTTNEGINQQHENLDQVAAAMNQMTVTVNQVASYAATAATSAQEAQEFSQRGQILVNSTAQQLEELAAKIEEGAGNLQKLEERTTSAGSVLEVIVGIAEQTNLLALNAAIEAARAGEQGRGFAVVADEVRSLASRTQASIVEIEDIIRGLQQEAQASAGQMHGYAQLAQGNVEQVKEARIALENLVASINMINELNTQVAAAAEQQASVAEDIDSRLVELADLAEINSAEATQVRSISRSIRTEVSELNRHLKKFKVEEA